jgi:beta-N-acetylhexosaminidase
MKRKLQAKQLSNSKYTLISFFLLILIFVFLFLNQVRDFSNTENIVIDDGKIDLNSLTLQQKMAQMIMVRGDKKNFNYNKMNVGGIFLDRQDSEEEYKELILNYQNNSKINLIVATDMEGAWTPFRKNVEEHQKFPDFTEIETKEEAYSVGKMQGLLLDSIGFNLNFAPVAEYEDLAYGGRVFSGNESQIQEKVIYYIRGLQENVFGTCKHYPGKSLLKNLHDETDMRTIEKKDIEIFEKCIENNISSIMVSHQIVEGVIDSEGKPSTISSEVIDTLGDFEGLIIADEINMKGLSSFYSDKINLYVDLINSGEEFILDFYLSDKEMKKLLENLEEKVLAGEIEKEKINEAVIKILEMKGYEVID